MRIVYKYGARTGIFRKNCLKLRLSSNADWVLLLNLEGTWRKWMDTHPPSASRIEILRAMTGSSDYKEYQNAFGRVLKEQLPISNDIVFGDNNSPIRDPYPAAALGSYISYGRNPRKSVPDADPPAQKLIRTRKTWDILSCIACGATKELSPDFCAHVFVCQKCGRKIYVEYKLDEQ